MTLSQKDVLFTQSDREKTLAQMLVFMQFYLDKHRPRSDQEVEAGVVGGGKWLEEKRQAS